MYLLLSKRIGNAIKMCDPFKGLPRLPPNAALGATMVNQEEWDRDIGKLRQAGERLGAQFTFASVEPMLEPIDPRGNFPDWVIVGGETGAQPRHLDPEWARSLRVAERRRELRVWHSQGIRRPGLHWWFLPPENAIYSVVYGPGGCFEECRYCGKKRPLVGPAE